MFSRFFIERPIFAAVVAIIICLAGLVSMALLPVSQYPSITPVQVTVIDGLIPLLDAGTGFMMIRRAVIERLMAAHPELHYASDDPDADPDSLTDSDRLREGLGIRGRRTILFSCRRFPIGLWGRFGLDWSG